MAFFEDLMARTAGGGGMPQQPEVAGGPPVPGQKQPFPNPPAAASGPAGRPSSLPSPFPGGAGAPLPLSPGAAGPAAGSGSAQGFRPPMPGQREPKSERERGQQTFGAAPGMGLPAPQPAVFQMDRVPTPEEMAEMPQGVSIQTPFGTMTKEGGLVLSPEGAMKYQQAIVAGRKKFGPHPWADDPTAPAPPVRLGGAMINPFTGQWSRG